VVTNQFYRRIVMKNRRNLLVAILILGAVVLAACGPRAAEDLEGELWALASYVNSQGEVVKVLSDTEMTATFVGGEVRGNAGCNSYFGSYQVRGNRLTIGTLASTEMYCALEEVMEQEMAYLIALETAASYEIQGDRLELWDADGARVATFNAVP
jgi:heat shock protein HslJ